MKRASPRRRARTDVAKERRRKSLVGAARKSFSGSAFEATTMAAIAASAGVAKGTAYLYFESKEALALTVAANEIEVWAEALRIDIDALADASARTIAQVVARSFAGRPLLLRLMPDLHTRIEAKTADGELLTFKRLLRAELATVGARMARTLGVDVEEGSLVLIQAYVYALGLAQLTDPPPNVARVLDADPTLAIFRVHFERDLARAVESLLAGLAMAARPSASA
jgi:AcrR family transcriptional regulator